MGTSPDPSDMAFYEEGVVTGEPEQVPPNEMLSQLEGACYGGSADSVRVSHRRPGGSEGAGGAGLQPKEESKGRSLLA